MLPFTILIHNANATPSPPTNHISLTHFLENNFQYPLQSSFNRHARIPSLLSNIFLWLAFLFTIIILHISKDEISTTMSIEIEPYVIGSELYQQFGSDVD
ncbi:unnamed protein product [Rotaria sp. Silwood2]|nr:unnamed protein product [Rotaria sp. Silwood2]